MMKKRLGELILMYAHKKQEKYPHCGLHLGWRPERVELRDSIVLCSNGKWLVLYESDGTVIPDLSPEVMNTRKPLMVDTSSYMPDATRMHRTMARDVIESGSYAYYYLDFPHWIVPACSIRMCKNDLSRVLGPDPEVSVDVALHDGVVSLLNDIGDEIERARKGGAH